MDITNQIGSVTITAKEVSECVYQVSNGTESILRFTYDSAIAQYRRYVAQAKRPVIETTKPQYKAGGRRAYGA